MQDATYELFVKRWKEVTDLPPQSVGPLTPLYKWFTRRFKVMPWPWFFVAGLMLALVLYTVFGSAISFIVTTLQRGF